MLCSKSIILTLACEQESLLEFDEVNNLFMRGIGQRETIHTYYLISRLDAMEVGRGQQKRWKIRNRTLKPYNYIEE